MGERLFAVIDGGVVSNVIVADDDFAALIRPDHQDVLEVTDDPLRPGITWAFQDGVFTAPAPVEPVEPEPVPEVVVPPSRAEFDALTSALESLTETVLGL